jgi:ABC-2 type transport system ATP-binding protein
MHHSFTDSATAVSRRTVRRVPAIVVDGLRKSFGELEAVKGISFTVEPGEVFALLGPNGAGKTTILEILEGFQVQTAGKVEVLGLDPRTGGRVLRERVGIVLQGPADEPYLTVRELVRRNAGYYPTPRPVDEVIQLVGLEEKRDARYKTLSGGQQRRLDVALGIVGRPELLFLDEPTTGFDPSARRGAWELVEQLATEGTTILLTTHYMDEAQHLAKRVAVISRGEIVAEGSPDTIGGRATAAARIRFMLPSGFPDAEVPIPHDAVDGYVVVTTDDDVRVLYELTSWALDRKVPLIGLSVDRPSLEDIYLDLVESEAPEASPMAEEASS